VTECWIIDASPLILLGKSGQLGWLQRMGRILVPESVANEVWPAHPPTPPASGSQPQKVRHALSGTQPLRVTWWHGILVRVKLP
jgi:hypothetical protein